MTLPLIYYFITNLQNYEQHPLPTMIFIAPPPSLILIIATYITYNKKYSLIISYAGKYLVIFLYKLKLSCIIIELSHYITLYHFLSHFKM